MTQMTTAVGVKVVSRYMNHPMSVSEMAMITAPERRI